MSHKKGATLNTGYVPVPIEDTVPVIIILIINPWKPYSEAHHDNRVSILQHRPAVFQLSTDERVRQGPMVDKQGYESDGGIV